MRRYQILDRRRVFDGFVSVDQTRFRFELGDGSMSPESTRLSAERGDSAAVLLEREDDRRVLLVRQFRHPVVRHGDPWLLEVVAGVLNADEAPEECARREAEEETGFRPRTLEKIGVFLSSPGGLTEAVHLYYGLVSDADRRSPGGGAEGEGEETELVEHTLDELLDLFEAGELPDGKTQVAILWLARRRAGSTPGSSSEPRPA